jgi:uncharacterized membrane protein YedE/YeeE
MRIDWTHFTPWTSLAGGVTLGFAAALLLLLVGRTLGISGIVDGALTARDREFGWRATFLLGLLAAPTALRLIAAPPPPTIETPWAQLTIAGVLVGFGT